MFCRSNHPQTIENASTRRKTQIIVLRRYKHAAQYVNDKKTKKIKIKKQIKNQDFYGRTALLIKKNVERDVDR